MVSLGKELHKARIDKGWSQQQVAALTGLKQKHISALECDKSIPTWPTIATLALALDLDLNALALGWAEVEREAQAEAEVVHGR